MLDDLSGRHAGGQGVEDDVGVTVRQVYELKRVDEDYFAANVS